MKILLLVVLAFSVFAFSGTALAKNKHHLQLAEQTPSCAVAPSQMSMFDPITISGSGWPANAALAITVVNNNPTYGGTAMGGAKADTAGNFEEEWQGVWPGINNVTVWEDVYGSALANCTFEVY